MMKKTILLSLLAIAFAAQAFSQVPYAEIATDSSLVAGEITRWVDFRAGLAFDDRFKLGLGIAVPARVPDVYYEGKYRKLEGSHGGVDLGARLFECGRFSVWADGLFGGGAFTYGGTEDASAPYLSAELRAMANVRLASFLKANFGAGYRGIYLTAKEDTVRNGDVSGLIWCVGATFELRSRPRETKD